MDSRANPARRCLRPVSYTHLDVYKRQDFAHQVFSETGFFNLPFRPQEKRVLSPIGEKAIQFQALVEGPLSDVGRAPAPVAVLLDRNHGWCESRWDREFAFGGDADAIDSFGVHFGVECLDEFLAVVAEQLKLFRGDAAFEDKIAFVLELLLLFFGDDILFGQGSAHIF